MTASSDIDALVERARGAIAAANSTEEIRNVTALVSGKKSPLAEASRGLGALDPEARRDEGRKLHEARTVIESLIEDRKAAIRLEELSRQMEDSQIDLTEFIGGSLVAPTERGHLHLVTQTRDALEDVFVGMGFEVAEGPEIETDWYNFEALNIPPAHPARGMFDTFYLEPRGTGDHPAAHPHLAGPDPPDGGSGGNDGHPAHPCRDARSLLPAGHARRPPPPGVPPDRGPGGGPRHRLRRPGRDHRGVHHRLLRTGHPLASATRLLPLHRAVGRVRGDVHHLPRGGMPDLLPDRVDRVGWCGMVDPAVFDAVGIDPEEWTGFAFGFGIDRCAQMRHQIADMRASPRTTSDSCVNSDAQSLRGQPCAHRFRGFETSPRSSGSRPTWPPLSTTSAWSWRISIRSARAWATSSSPGSRRSPRSRGPTRSAGWWWTPGTGPIEVVCGAWNFEVGDLVALAPVGAVLPGGFTIKRRQDEGVVSNGMLCSGRELDLSDDHEGILRLNDMSRAAEVGRPLTEVLGIEPDVIFDIAVEANRPDAWSIAGVARDLAARMGVPFAIPLPCRPLQTPGPHPANRRWAPRSRRWHRSVSTTSSCAPASRPG
jgi:phenylalanyl-tRNA synthetase alpha chain